MVQKNLDFGSASGPEAQQTRVPSRRTLSISALTERIRGCLETEFFDVWVEGEISNLTRATSGHWYFSLKDDAAQIAAVVWKTATRQIRFRPEDGMKVVARGGVRVYPPRGAYQISVELLEPLGKGSLQEAFEQLKRKLDLEGLFATDRKRTLPMLPRRIGVITSPTGAAIQDVLRVLQRRYRNLEVVIYPARVQGAEAASEITQGLRELNRLGGFDVIVLARGGGSLEDLWAFNEETVARGIAASRIPVLSAVGHETDFTIADFVADVRAATPSAAAEMVVRAKASLADRISALDDRHRGAMMLRLTRTRARLEYLTSHRVFTAERGRLGHHAQRIDEWVRRMEFALQENRSRARVRLNSWTQRLDAFRWERQVAVRKARLAHALSRLEASGRRQLERRRESLAQRATSLENLSPIAVLGRGYALVWDERRQRLIRDASTVSVGDAIHLELHRGRVDATITDKEES